MKLSNIFKALMINALFLLSGCVSTMPQQEDTLACPERKQPDPRYMLEPESAKIIDTETVEDDIALKVIADNYAICDATRDQLLGLQEWIRSQKN